MSPCKCDYCTGVKKRSDNWCACCGEVQLVPPKWWENLDVCDACDVRLKAKYGEPEQEGPPFDRGLAPRIHPPCSLRIRVGSSYGFCLQPDGHVGDCQGVLSEEVVIEWDPKRRPRWGL